jgi:hypothetical protein
LISSGWGIQGLPGMASSCDFFMSKHFIAVTW